MPQREASLRERVAWALVLAACAPIIVFAANGTVLLLGVCVLALPAIGDLRAELGRAVRSPVGILLMALGIWLAVSAAWSLDPGEAGRKAVRLWGVALAGLAALAAVRNASERIIYRAICGVPVAAGLIMLMYWVELGSGGAIISILKGIRAEDFSQYSARAQQESYRQLVALNQIGRGSVLLAIFIWPVVGLAGRLPRGIWIATGLAGAAFMTAVYLPIGAAPLGFLAGMAGFALCYLAPRAGPRIVAGMAALAVLLMPVSAYWLERPETVGADKRALPISWQHRVEIWHFTAERIAEKPLLGWGFDASRNMDVSQTQFVAEMPDGSDIAHPGITLLPLHPHNGILQIWLELGLPGAVLAMLFVLAFGRSVSRLHASRHIRACAAGAFTSAFTIACLSFGLWQTWWQVSFWLATLLVVFAARSADSVPAEDLLQ